MNIEELYEMLEIENGEEFQYFENFADLVEHDGLIDNDVIFELINDIDMKVFAELCESYFYEMAENIPGDQIDVANLAETIKRVLIGLSEAIGMGEENADGRLADELNRFRTWYAIDYNVECKNLKTKEVVTVPVRDALVTSRLERIEGDENQYDFTEALDYKLDEFMMTYSDLVSD